MKKQIIILFFLSLFSANFGLLFSQVILEDEYLITDEGLFFDGDLVPEAQRLTHPNRTDGKYDYAFGNRITPHGDCVAQFGDYVYVTWYRGGKNDRHVMLTRVNMVTKSKVTIEFPHRHTGFHNIWWVGESHNTIAVGICPIDETVHLLYDMHAYSATRPADGSLANDYFRYSVSEKNVATLPDEDFTIDKFLPKRLYLKQGENYEGLTYPEFFVNTDNELLVKMRAGGSSNGKFQMAKYDGNLWSNWVDYNVLNASSRPQVNYNWGLYGDFQYLHGKFQIGYAIRKNDNTDRYLYNNGFFYSYSNAPDGSTDWYNYKGEQVSSPIINPYEVFISEPGDQVTGNATNSVTISSGPIWTVTERGDIHFMINNVRGANNPRVNVHTYKKASDSVFTTTTSFPGGDEFLSVGNDIYLIGLSNGRPFIRKAEGGTNDWTLLYQATSGKSFRHGNVLARDGKVYYYLMENKTGNAQPIYLQVYDLGIVPYDPNRELSFKNITDNQVFVEGTNLTIEANVGSDFTEVTLWKDTINLGTLTSAPFTWSGHAVLTNMEESVYTFKLVAKDSSNVDVECSVTITVVAEEPAAVDVYSMIRRLVFYCPLESDGTDFSGNGNHATPGSAVTFAPGKFGKGAVFSHVQGSFLTTADSIFKYSYPTAYTIAFWLKVADYSVRRDILQPVEGRTLLYSNGDLSFRSFHQKNVASFSVAEDEKDEWLHVALVLDQREGQTQHKFYVKGVPRGNNPSGYPLETEKPMSVSRMVFGAASDVALSRNFTGMLDEIYMFDEVLSDEEIASLMHTENLMSLAGTSSVYINFDDPDTASDWILEGDNAATASVVDFALSRNGSKVLKVEGFNINTGFHFHNISSDKVVAKPGQWVHSIIHASSALAGGQAQASFGSEWASVAPSFKTISTFEMTQLDFKRQYPDTETAYMYIFPRLRLRPGADLTNEIYFDDLVLYVHDSEVIDLFPPDPATDFTFVSQTANMNEFSWTEGYDALTGVQETYILRTSNTSADAPELLPQVGYSVTGGSAGTDTIGDWKVIALVNAGVTRYNDESVASGEDYLYAIVHKDLAYNNSIALISPFDYTTSSEVSGTTLTETKIRVYPVPVKHILNVSGVDFSTAKVYSMTGQLILEFTEVNNGLNISSLSNGLYILKLSDNKGTIETLRFVKK